MTNEEELIQQKQQLTVQIAQLDDQLIALRKTRSNLSDSLTKVKQQLAALKIKKPLRVTDHAILRYLQRYTVKITPQDVEAARIALLPPQLQEMVDTVGGTGKFPIGDGHVVLKDYTIVTYTTCEKENV